MIDLYYWPTPNGHKITIFLEETGTPYTIIPVNIGAGDQFKPEFLEISPNNRMPAIVDHAPADSGPADIGIRVRSNPDVPGGEDRPVPAEGARAAASKCCSGCSGRWPVWGRWRDRTIISHSTRRRNFRTRSIATSGKPRDCMRSWTSSSRIVTFLAGDYSIADMAAYPWVVPYQRQQQNLDDFPDSEALVRKHPFPACGGACLREGQSNQQSARSRREITHHPVRAKCRDGTTMITPSP